MWSVWVANGLHAESGSWCGHSSYTHHLLWMTQGLLHLVRRTRGGKHNTLYTPFLLCFLVTLSPVAPPLPSNFNFGFIAQSSSIVFLMNSKQSYLHCQLLHRGSYTVCDVYCRLWRFVARLISHSYTSVKACITAVAGGHWVSARRASWQQCEKRHIFQWYITVYIYMKNNMKGIQLKSISPWQQGWWPPFGFNRITCFLVVRTHLILALIGTKRSWPQSQYKYHGSQPANHSFFKSRGMTYRL